MKSVLALLLIIFVPLAAAKEKPLWEVGAGFGSYMSPHYLGADQSTTYTLPLPFAVYRGEYIRSSRGGFMGKIYESDRLDLRVSLGASLPVNNKDNKAREGMPDIDLMLEAGPTLQYRLYKSDIQELRVDLPVRAAFSFGDEVAYRGVIVSPRFYYQLRPDHWKITGTFGPVYSSSKYHEVFYDVKNQYVTDERAEYKANAGYTGMRYSFSVSRRFGQFFIGTFFNYYDIEGAENEDSPLVKQTDYFAAAFAFSWVFAQSKKMVNGDD